MPSAACRLGVNLDDAQAALDSLDTPGIGIACYNGDVATALLAAAHTRSLRAPDDVALIGMDHTPLGQVTTPRLTTLSYDVTAGGRAAVSLILAGLTGEQRVDPITDLHLQIIPGETT